MVFKKIKNIFGSGSEKLPETEEYVEVDIGRDASKKVKIVVRPFILKAFEDVGRILEILREGYTIAIIDIKPLKNKDIVELKRAISKLKKTTDALEGNIAGFGENTIVVTPSFAEIYKGQKVESVEKK